MSIAEPLEDRMDVDSDDDMDTVTGHHNQTQFTQSLMLFVRPLFHPCRRPLTSNTPFVTLQSQLGGGRPRYIRSLTRFFAQLRPHALLMLIMDALTEMGVKQNPAKELTADPTDPDSVPQLRMRIGAKDRRKIHMKGYVILEDFELGGHTGSFIQMERDAVSRRVVLVHSW